MSLVLPLRRLDPDPARQPDPVARARRTLDLDAPAGLEVWSARVRDAAEACLVVDAGGRLVALSPSCAELLRLDAAGAVGALLADLLDVVDSGPGAVPVEDPAVAVPPLRSLADQRQARGLVRLRQGLVLRTYDVVSVPLAGGAGALAFVAAV